MVFEQQGHISSGLTFKDSETVDDSIDSLYTLLALACLFANSKEKNGRFGLKNSPLSEHLLS